MYCFLAQQVEVHLPSGTTTDGFLGLYDDDIAIVTSLGFLGVHPVDLDLDAPANAPGGSTIAGRACLQVRHFDDHECVCNRIELHLDF